MWTDSAIGYRLSAIGLHLERLIADSRWPMALFGMPDYARYLEHQRRCHPTASVLNEKDYVRSELERKYAGGGGRCC